MDSEPLVSLKFEFKNQLQALFETIAPRHGHWLTRNREVNKTNTRAVEGLSEEAINAREGIDYLLLAQGYQRLDPGTGEVKTALRLSEDSPGQRTCPDNLIFYKHIFLVSRTHSIAYYDTTAITHRVINESSDNISNSVIEESSNDLREILQQQGQLQLET
ncbi:hypothetical protein HPULCUR_008366 [Helicostylum pulchrum]|uniref:Uncharacterized protein n=1 Tax=Helicostylum pulchrum TaxID=562976 RepID=A0ABP9Y7E0_9FUNG